MLAVRTIDLKAKPPKVAIYLVLLRYIAKGLPEVAGIAIGSAKISVKVDKSLVITLEVAKSSILIVEVKG